MIRIRKLLEHDWPLFKKTFYEVNQTEFPEFSKKTRHYLTSDSYCKKRMFEAGLVLGAFDREKIVGFLVAATPFAGVMSIAWLSVLKPYQRKGIGKALLIRAETYALKHGIHNIQIGILKRNIEFYERCGFKIFGYDEKSYFGVSVFLVKKLIQEPREDKFLERLNN